MAEENEIDKANKETLSESLEVENVNETDENKNENRLELMLKENLSCEMFHFALNIFYSPHLVLKIVFALSLLLAYGLASYTTITLILTYLEYGVITTIRTINETPADFPKVKICNKIPFTTKYAYEFLSQSNLFNMSEINKTLNGDRTVAIQYFARLRSALFGQIQNFSTEQKRSLSHDLNDTLLSCLFSYESCNSNDFQWEWDNNYGNCFIFNTGYNSWGEKIDIKKSNIEGSIYGLQVEFYVNYFENLTFFDFFLETFGNGLVVRIDNVSVVLDYSHDGIFALPGIQTFLALDRQFKTTLHKPYSICDDLNTNNFNSNLFDLISQSKYTYTQTFCIQQCFQELLYKECKCKDSDFASLENASYCSNTLQLQCAWKAWTDTYLKNNYVQDICIPQCPLECNLTQISFVSSSNELIPSLYIDLLKKNPNLLSDFINRSIDDESVILQSIVKLNIFYNSLSYTVSTESPQMDIISLIANIGGNLGLFMGVCLFSLAEIVVTLIEIFMLKWPINKKEDQISELFIKPGYSPKRKF